jgi:imidazole glycerol-phosphate synthase subunit HisH
MSSATNGYEMPAPRSPNVVVVDYGVNNIGSVLNMLGRLDVDATAGRCPDDVASARALILPGIGAFDSGVANLRAAGLFDSLREAVIVRRVPILGICLGMQLLGRGSEEGRLEGLGLLPAQARRFSFAPDPKLRIPHMGWNVTDCLDRDLFAGFGSDVARFYYVHSYHVVCDDPSDVAARCTYGETFAGAVRRGRVFGTQFHPEKSHTFGMRVLANFVRIACHA